MHKDHREMKCQTKIVSYDYDGTLYRGEKVSGQDRTLV